MPKAFCGLALCAKMLSELCALCERKISPASLAIVLFLTDLHRRTEHTKSHRDVKLTDFTEPYSQQNPHSQSRSFQEHVLPHSRTCPSPFENMPFYVQEHALLDAWQGPSSTQLATCWFHVGYRDRRNIHTEREFNIQRHNDIKTYNDKKNMLRRVFNVYRHNDIKTYNDRKNMMSRVFNGYRQNDIKTYNDRKNMLRRVFNGYRQNDRVT